MYIVHEEGGAVKMIAAFGGGATPIAFLVGGVIAALTAYSYAKLSVSMPSATAVSQFLPVP